MLKVGGGGGGILIFLFIKFIYHFSNEGLSSAKGYRNGLALRPKGGGLPC